MYLKSVLLAFVFLFQLMRVFCTRNILLIIVDDLRPALGCYGDKNAHTPNIDAFAEESVVFKRAYAQQALCAPSRNSLLTSRRPDTLHLYDFYSYWRNAAGNFTTLPQYFKENGYVTKSIGKIFHPGISSNFSDDQPYSWTETPYHPPTEEYKEAEVCPDPASGKLCRNLVCPVDVKFQPGGTLPDLESIYEAKKFLESDVADKPFFLAVGLHKPHVPLKYPKKFLAYHPLENVTVPGNRFRPYGVPTVAWNPWNDLRKRHDINHLDLSFPFEPMPDDWTKLIIQSYYAAVTYIDELIGQLLLSLKEERLDKNTIVALIGDHGWSLGEHSEWSKFSNYEVAVNVPFILRAPQFKKNSKDKHLDADEFVELVDIFPTLAQLAGISEMQQCPLVSDETMICSEGTSLVPLLESVYGVNTTKHWKKWKTAAFSQYPRPGLYPTTQPDSDRPRLKDIKIMGYTMRTDQYRYTEWVRFKSFAPDWSTVYSSELYDYAIDSGENLNLADRPGLDQIKCELSKKLREGWRSSLPAFL